MADHPPLPKRRKPKPKEAFPNSAPAAKKKMALVPIDLVQVDRLIDDTFGSAGRPYVEIDLLLVERAASVGCAIDEIAVICDVSRAAFYNRKEAGPEIDEAITRGREMGRYTLRRLQWHKAQLGSDQMLIWLGKQWLGQRDNLNLGMDGKEVAPPSINVTVVEAPVRHPTIDVHLNAQDADVHMNGHDTTEHAA